MSAFVETKSLRAAVALGACLAPQLAAAGADTDALRRR
jgi:hypothetical protein